MGHQKIKISLALGLIAAVIGGFYWFMPAAVQPLAIKKIQINGQDLAVEIAEKPAAQQRGLSGRDSLGADSGMLFVYKDKAIRYFWMPNMRFPLDVLWIADGQVVGLQENIPPLTGAGEITRFQSNVPADAVLEVNVGWIKRFGVKPGDIVIFMHR